MIHPLLPSWSALNTIFKEMDARSTIHPTPGPIIGIQQSLKQQLTVRLENLVKKFPNMECQLQHAYFSYCWIASKIPTHRLEII